MFIDIVLDIAERMYSVHRIHALADNCRKCTRPLFMCLFSAWWILYFRHLHSLIHRMMSFAPIIIIHTYTTFLTKWDSFYFHSLPPSPTLASCYNFEYRQTSNSRLLLKKIHLLTTNAQMPKGKASIYAMACVWRKKIHFKDIHVIIAPCFRFETGTRHSLLPMCARVCK